MIFREYPTDFIVGLCAFVRQAALSVDRAFSDSFQADLRSYYSQGGYPSVDAILRVLRSSGRRKVLPLKALFTGSRVFLCQRDLDRVEAALVELADLLGGREEFTQAQRMSLRLELSNIESAFYRKLSEPLEDKIRSVEHYNQADVVPLQTLQEIAGEEWPMVVRS